MNEQEFENRIKALEQEISHLNALVDRIYSYTHLGIHKPSFDNATVFAGAGPIIADGQLQQLIQNDNIIGAAKRYVALTGVGLLEAKTAVQKMMH